MNWVDLVIVGMLILFAVESFRRPLIFELLDLISFVLAGILSFTFYNIPAKFFEKEFHIPHGLSLVLGFMSVWFLTEIMFYLFIRLILPKTLKLKIPRFLSVVPAVLKGLIFIGIALVITATFPIQPVIKKAVLESRLGSQILKYTYNLEQPVKQVFGGVANDTLAFFTIEPKTTESVNLGFQTDQFSTDTESENLMLNLVNNERVREGLKPLVPDAKLKEIAREHSADMFRRGYFSHYSPEGQTVADRAEKVGISYLIIGENLAYAPSLELAHKGLINSPGHRANILSQDFGRVGIGVLDAGVYGKMFTQAFGN